MTRLRALLASWAALSALSCAARPAPPAAATVFVRARPEPAPAAAGPAFSSTAVPAAPATLAGREGPSAAHEVVTGPPPVAPKPLPSRSPRTPKPSPQQTAADATKKAAQAPEAADYVNAIVQYSYEPGSLYQVYAAPMHITDIALEPGEKILGAPASGDSVRWLLALGKSMVAGAEQAHVYLKPTRPDLETNLAINTDRRSYLLELHSYPDDTYMAAVDWRYPEEELARLQAQQTETATEERAASPVVSLDSLNFHYTIQVLSGAPAWMPLQAFDDGKKTFVRFPPGMLLRESPALFVVRDKQTELVNYRVKGDIYVVDRLFDVAELRVGQQDQEVVRIQRGDPVAVRTLTRPIHGRY